MAAAARRVEVGVETVAAAWRAEAGVEVAMAALREPVEWAEATRKRARAGPEHCKPSCCRSAGRGSASTRSCSRRRTTQARPS